MRTSILTLFVIFIAMTTTALAVEDADDDVSYGERTFGRILSRKRRDFALSTGLQFLGIGYHIFKGSPDGGLAFEGNSRATRDPGLMMNRKIIKWSEKYKREESGADVPDEVVFGGYQHSCVKMNSFNMLYGAKSYQTELRTQLEISVELSFWIFSAKFSVSHSVKTAKNTMNTEKNVFFRRSSTCIHGTVRYRELLAGYQKHALHEDFVSHVCRLPVAKVSADKKSMISYLEFINTWGTHMTTKVEFGSKNIELYRQTVTELLREVSRKTETGVSVSAGIGPFSVKAKLNVKKFSEYAKKNEKKIATFATKIVMGTREKPEPVRPTILLISYLMKEKFWKAKTSRCSNGSLPYLKRIEENLNDALNAYPNLSHLDTLSDLPLEFEVTWPRGKYGLIAVDNACPFSKSKIWRTSSLKMSVETKDPEVVLLPQSETYGYGYGYGSSGNGGYSYGRKRRSLTRQRRSSSYVALNMQFCKKTADERADIQFDWPKGEYCIVSAHKNRCPEGFTTASLTVLGKLDGWNEFKGYTILASTEPWVSNRPNGFEVHLCCRQDGFTSNPLLLPTNKPFVLFPTIHICQTVVNMKASRSYVKGVHLVSGREAVKTASKTLVNGAKPFVARNGVQICTYRRG